MNIHLDSEKWTVWAKEKEHHELERRDTYDSLDVACEMAEEIVAKGFFEAVVKDSNGKWVQKVGV